MILINEFYPSLTDKTPKKDIEEKQTKSFSQKDFHKILWSNTEFSKP